MRAIVLLCQLTRDLLRSRRATTALELALVGPFLIVVFLMIIENGLMLFAQASLDNATDLAARQIQIGKITTQNDFQSALCSYTASLFNCANFQVYVASSSSSFPSASMPNSSGVFPTQTFSPGGPQYYVTAEVAYNRSYISPWLIGLGNGWILLSTSAFQNEPPQS